MACFGSETIARYCDLAMVQTLETGKTIHWANENIALLAISDIYVWGMVQYENPVGPNSQFPRLLTELHWLSKELNKTALEYACSSTRNDPTCSFLKLSTSLAPCTQTTIISFQKKYKWWPHNQTNAMCDLSAWSDIHRNCFVPKESRRCKRWGPKPLLRYSTKQLKKTGSQCAVQTKSRHEFRILPVYWSRGLNDFCVCESVNGDAVHTSLGMTANVDIPSEACVVTGFAIWESLGSSWGV